MSQFLKEEKETAQKKIQSIDAVHGCLFVWKIHMIEKRFGHYSA